MSEGNVGGCETLASADEGRTRQNHARRVPRRIFNAFWVGGLPATGLSHNPGSSRQRNRFYSRRLAVTPYEVRKADTDA